MSLSLIPIILFLFVSALLVFRFKKAGKRAYVGASLLLCLSLVWFLSFCTSCWSSAHVLHIAYGMPGPQLLEKARKGEVLLGGCLVDWPIWYCKKCNRRWPSWPGKPIEFSKSANPYPIEYF